MDILFSDYKSYQHIMKGYIILVLVAVLAAAQNPPVWPVRFEQDFVESYTTSRLRVVGKLWYDS